VLNVQNSRAIILAAGLSTRMGSLAAGRPKCLLELHGLSVLQHQLDALHQLGVGRVTIVTGHGAEAVRAAAGEQAEFIHFDGYAGGNNLRTLHHARTLLEGDVVVLFADVLLTMATLGDLVRHSAPMALLVDESTCRPDTMRVRLENDRVVDIGPHIGVGGGHGNFVGVAAFRAAGTLALRGELDAIGTDPALAQHYYTEALRRLAGRGEPVSAVSTRGAPWLELDTPPDVEMAARQDFYAVPNSNGTRRVRVFGSDRAGASGRHGER
jgi:choline kinase